jgi:predicted lipoprotein
MNKLWQKGLLGVVILLVAYNSIYFKKLDEVKAATTGFDGVAYASKFWSEKLVPAMEEGVDLSRLLLQLQTNPEPAFASHSHALGIGNIKYFPVKGEATVEMINENEFVISLDNQPSGTVLMIANEYIFGNAVRDASGQIDINAFTNTRDFNTVSAEINNIIRTKVIPSFKDKVKTGDRVRFTGAIELNQKYLNLNAIEIIPVSLSVEKQY